MTDTNPQQTAIEERVARHLASKDWLTTPDRWDTASAWFRADYLAFAREVIALVQPDAPASTPTDWIDGHPQLEAIAAAVWERCGRSDSGGCVEDDPRNIAVAALAAVLPASGPGGVAGETPQPPPAFAPGMPCEHGCRAAADTLARETQAVHRGGNAEDCPACHGADLPYPFICPGPDAAVSQPDGEA